MAGYHRFISYIYLYERGIKTMNTGFAKVESRDSQCMISISMKNMYHESHVKFSVYMFVRKDGRLLGIFLGELSTSQSCGEFSCITDPDNIQDSGYTLEDVKGMIIRGDNGKIYGTGWDDEVLAVDRFAPIGETPEPVAVPEPKGEPEPAAVPELKGAPGAVAMPELKGAPEPAAVSKSKSLPEPMKMSGLKSRAAAFSDMESGPESAPVSSEQSAGLKSRAAALSDTESGSESARMLPGQSAKPENTSVLPEQSAKPESVSVLSGQSVSRETAPVLPEQSSGPELASESGAAFFVENDRLDKMAPDAEHEPNILEKMLDQGMRMYPFEDDEMRACVRLEPQDIGRLPMQYWRLAGNSFLLHGYYSYRHLIMAQKNDGTYILGIPGINYERENFMAQMFGFHKFKTVRAHIQPGGAFGYWYTELA